MERDIQMKTGFLDKARAFAEFAEPRYVETVGVGTTEGWHEREVAAGLLWRAVFHFKMLDGNAIDLADVEAEVNSLLQR